MSNNLAKHRAITFKNYKTIKLILNLKNKRDKLLN